MASRVTKAELQARIEHLQTIISDQSRQIDELREVGMTSEARNKMQLELDAAHAYENVLKGLNERLKLEIERLKNENASLKEQLTALSSSASPRSKPGRKPSVTDEMIADIISMRDAGWSIRDIADYMGISKSTVHRILQEKRP